MQDVNLCVFSGRLGADPEVRYMTNGDAVTNFSLATGESWKSKTGERQERTTWVKCTAFGKLAEIAGEYCEKGAHVMVMGKYQTRTWEDKEGTKKNSTEIKLDKLHILSGKGKGKEVGEEGASTPDDTDNIPF